MRARGLREDLKIPAILRTPMTTASTVAFGLNPLSFCSASVAGSTLVKAGFASASSGVVGSEGAFLGDVMNVGLHES